MSFVNDKDERDYAELLRALRRVDAWLARMDPDARGLQPQPKSPLHGDDDRTRPYQVSHAAWNSLTHAVDHLHCLRSVLQDARLIHMFAPFSLVRPALENASAGVWILKPQRRCERITRRLRLAADDIRKGEEARRLTGSTGPRSQEERLGDIRDIAKQVGVEPAVALGRVGYGEIIAAVSSPASPAADVNILCWRLCSGVAHGDFWTTINATDRIELPPISPDVGAFKITAHMGLLGYVTRIAVEMTALGWRLYDQRCSPPY